MEEERSKRFKDHLQWQKSLLPLMSRTIIILSIFFFLASLAQLIYLHQTIANSPKINVQSAFTSLNDSSRLQQENILLAARLKSLVILETAAMEKQYFQANMLLMGRLWTSYIGFVTGMIMAIVGATFILGKLREPVSELNTKLSGNEISLKTASPGILMSVLGTCLMVTTLVTNHEITTSQKALYLYDLPSSIDPLANPADSAAKPPLRSSYSFQDSTQ